MNYITAFKQAVNKQPEFTTDKLDPDKTYTTLMFCSKCKNHLITSRTKTGAELKEGWAMMVMSAGFAAPKCPICKYSTFSDLNIGTDLLVLERDHSADQGIASNNKSALASSLEEEQP